MKAPATAMLVSVMLGCAPVSSPGRLDAREPLDAGERLDAGIDAGGPLDAGSSAGDAGFDTPIDAGTCAHGSATAPDVIYGRTFKPVQRAAAQVVFAGDPFPAILIEAGPIPRCAEDPPPAGGPGNTLITFITDWPLQPGPAENLGVYLHQDDSRSPVSGTGTMSFTSVPKKGLITGSMTVQFPGDATPARIDFEAVDVNAVL